MVDVSVILVSANIISTGRYPSPEKGIEENRAERASNAQPAISKTVMKL
jgi:hypothetical protein